MKILSIIILLYIILAWINIWLTGIVEFW
jgi:hypothetical protein